MSGITCPSPNFTQAFNLWVLAPTPLPRCFIKFLWGWLLSLILTGGQRKKVNKRNQWWGRQSLHSPPSILSAASSFIFYFFCFSSLIVWSWQGPCGWVWAPWHPVADGRTIIAIRAEAGGVLCRQERLTVRERKRNCERRGVWKRQLASAVMGSAH